MYFTVSPLSFAGTHWAALRHQVRNSGSLNQAVREFAGKMAEIWQVMLKFAAMPIIRAKQNRRFAQSMGAGLVFCWPDRPSFGKTQAIHATGPKRAKGFRAG
jgi:hypothetical protein